MWLPGVGNHQDSAGVVAAAIDYPVGRAGDVLGTAHLTQATAGFKPMLRHGPKNLLTNSEFQNGLSDAPTRGGLISSSTIPGFSGAIAFGVDGTSASFAYKGYATITGSTYSFSLFVLMDDGLAPSFNSASSTNPANDFSLVCNGAAISPLFYSVVGVGGGVYRVRVTTAAIAGVNFGVAKFGTNSARTFRVTGYQLVAGRDACNYKKTTSAALSTGGTGSEGPYWWDFDGADDRLSCAQIINTAIPHALIVAGHAELASATLAGQYSDANNVGPLCRFASTLSTSAGYYREASIINSQSIATPPYVALERTVMSVRYSGGNISARRGSTEAVGAALIGSIPAGAFNVGAGGASPALSEFLKGGIYGVFACQADMLRSEVIAIERWFARSIRAAL